MEIQQVRKPLAEAKLSVAAQGMQLARDAVLYSGLHSANSLSELCQEDAVLS